MDIVGEMIVFYVTYMLLHTYVHGLVQEYSISSALAMEILQSYTKPSIYCVCWTCPYFETWRGFLGII